MVSVCIASYNGCKYMKEQLISILSQLSCDDEIIVSDDGSCDGTLEIVSNMEDSRIKEVLNIEKHGVVPNFENAIKYASGDYIFLCDQDDLWVENKVKTCVEALQSVDLVVHNSLLMDGVGNVSDIDFFSLRKSTAGYWKNLYKNSFIGCCMAFRREILDYVLPFPEHILWHDMWIGLMVEKKGKTMFIEDKLLYYRRHDNNASATAEKSSFSFLFQIKYRLQMFGYTLIR
ncbi:glycosyltransferase family 2 protein [Phocaeicola sartorii]|uniref:glycosyltransferase family 2 protein n=1 Tax=Phocaeicola sartorii TaxID=671267 RepID=UPI0013638741|nr:glycosyltransferase family 2 protein [Phocaeicola sartorii]NBH67237.1 glycosyltransferase family 2 protein [Phocaeicola sartorii]